MDMVVSTPLSYHARLISPGSLSGGA
ncbi:hypothetical protein NC651_019633 [Populus alba x Populus x berolinensis]|nr:hypothetical protein NC651_019633 [Populus alba x Populus x berolinensis]